MTDAGLRGIVYLADEPPFFEGEQRPNDATVLAYSGEIVWEIDQASPVEASARELFFKSGCIIRNENGWLINVEVGYGATLRQMQFNINTGQLSYYQQQLQKVVIFGAWSAFIEDKERPFEGRIKIASFDIRSTGTGPAMTKIFVSYSHADEEFCDMLQKHLAALKHQGLIETWHDRRINVGDEFENVIDRHLNDAHIILLLVSADFIASRYCYEVEMRRALERHRAGEARVIPVILRPCDWQDMPFGSLLAAPKDGKSVKTWPDIDEAFLDVVKQIKAVVGEQKPVSVAPTVPLTPAGIAARVVDRPRSGNLTIRKVFTESDKDDFLERCYVYIAAYFENSLAELEDRNPELSTRFRKIDENQFTAVVYRDGNAAARCKISVGGMFGHSITFAYGDHAGDSGFSESLSVEADDQHLYLRAMGMAYHMAQRKQNLTQEGGAELYWSLLIKPLQ